MSLPFSYWTGANADIGYEQEPYLSPSHYLDLGNRNGFEKFIYIFTTMSGVPTMPQTLV